MPTVRLLCHTPEPEKIVAAAAKLCYASQGVEGLLDGLTPEKTEKFIQMLMGLGHQSPVEHAVFTFGIEGVSRSFLAQMTRHRIASYSVQSQRYVRMDPFPYVTPPEIAADPEATAAYQRAMKASLDSYRELVEILERNHTARLTAQGLEEKDAQARASKMANEDARFVLPNACETKMVVTMNVRSLYNFFRLRCCSRAQWEIRAVADEMFRLVRQVAPTLFVNAGPPCVCGPCPEGKMSCGKAEEMRRKFRDDV